MASKEVAEGKDDSFPDSDEDDVVAMKTFPKSGPKTVSKRGSKLGMYCTDEQLFAVRIQSPHEKQEVRCLVLVRMSVVSRYPVGMCGN